jgi:hypothetical protein
MPASTLDIETGDHNRDRNVYVHADKADCSVRRDGFMPELKVGRTCTPTIDGDGVRVVWPRPAVPWRHDARCD